MALMKMPTNVGSGGSVLNPQTLTNIRTRTDWNTSRTLSQTLTVGKTYTLVFGIYGQLDTTIDLSGSTGMDILNVSYGYIGVYSAYYTAVVVTFKATATSATIAPTVLSGGVTNYTGETLVQLD